MRFEASEALTARDLHDVGTFRYRCYASEGLIGARADETFLDEYDFADSAKVLMIKLRGQIVGTIRLHLLDASSAKSATMVAFNDMLTPKIDKGLKIVDGARFAVEPGLGALRFSIARHTLRLYSHFADANRADYGVAAVSCDRLKFYKRLFGFSQISTPRKYGQLNKKLALIGVDLCGSTRLGAYNLGRNARDRIAGVNLGERARELKQIS